MKKKYKIEEIDGVDAFEFLKLRNKTEAETDAMMFVKNERKTTVEQMKRKIEYYKKILKGAVFVIRVNKKMVGFILIYGSPFKILGKTRDISMAVLKKQWGKGIGKAMLYHAIDWAKKKKIHRLSLEVWSDNKRAIELYLKSGFKKEGTRKDHALIKGKYVDLICMGMILK